MHMLFSIYRCQGAGCCADPLNCQPILLKNARYVKYGFSESWKARKAEIGKHAAAAKAKVEKSQKKPVVHDITIAKVWWDSTANNFNEPGGDLQRLTLMQILAQICDSVDFCSVPKPLCFWGFNPATLLQRIAKTKPLTKNKTTTYTEDTEESTEANQDDHKPDTVYNEFDYVEMDDDLEDFPIHTHQKFGLLWMSVKTF